MWILQKQENQIREELLNVKHYFLYSYMLPILAAGCQSQQTSSELPRPSLYAFKNKWLKKAIAYILYK